MSQSATPATQNHMTTCLKTFEKERFCSFPHGHSKATGKPKTRDETRGRSKTSISWEISSNFDTFDTLSTCLKTFEKERFCSFPHGHSKATGKPKTRDETRGRSKTSISWEISSNFDTFNTLSNRLACHKVPHLPRKTT